MHELQPFLSDQDGVISRRQVHDAGLAPHQLERLLRRRVLTPLHQGVYVDHSGQPTYRQRVWGALLLYEPAAAAGATSLWLTDAEGAPPATVQLVVPRSRRIQPPRGIEVTRSDPLHAEVQWAVRPPRVRYEAAVVQLAADALDELAAVGVLTKAMATRRTTPERLMGALSRRSRVRRRAWLEAVLEDMRLGTHSVLEHGYLQRVERAHRLPASRWQCRETVRGRTVYRDAIHHLPGGDLVVELDGRAHHDDARRREQDYERDLEVVAGGRLSVRLTWGQVFGSPCRTARLLARILAGLGWRGLPRPCGAGCQ